MGHGDPATFRTSNHGEREDVERSVAERSRAPVSVSCDLQGEPLLVAPSCTVSWLPSAYGPLAVGVAMPLPLPSPEPELSGGDFGALHRRELAALVGGVVGGGLRLWRESV